MQIKMASPFIEGARAATPIGTVLKRIISRASLGGLAPKVFDVDQCEYVPNPTRCTLPSQGWAA
jgi:hypothetical protein